MSESPWCHLDAPDLDRLDLASIYVREVLQETPYLVGSCLVRPDHRDVDVRVILDDDRFAAWFGTRAPYPHRDPLRDLVQVAITDHYVKATGLRIDFQIQPRTWANEKYPGAGINRRHPLGIYPWQRTEEAPDAD